MEVYEVDSIVRGHHVFKKIWTPFIGEGFTERSTQQFVNLSSLSVSNETFIGRVVTWRND